MWEAEGHLGVSNSNYVILSPQWNLNLGAATFGSGQITGTITAANSLVGTKSTDEVGYNGGTALTNGNYAIASSYASLGAVTFGQGTTGTVGDFSADTSLVGSTSDLVGSNGGLALANGNYVVFSPRWNGELGAATFGNGTTGITQFINETNSLIGSTPGDSVSNNFGGIALTNGNYVVFSESWNNSIGAATFGNGNTGITGLVTTSNSLTGTTSGDKVSLQGGIALTTGNYVVFSPDWNNGLGAATFGNGTTGIINTTVDSSNSLVGSSTTDLVGNFAGIALANGHYVVFSPFWNNNTGAATWGDGNTGITGIVSSSNSLIGSVSGDAVSENKGIALANGNYVIFSPYWNNFIGAATWCPGTGVIGTVTAENSLTGTLYNDLVSTISTPLPSFGGFALANGNYVVLSARWNNSTGAATFVDGATGIPAQETSIGVQVSAHNSLIGSAAGQTLGFNSIALANGNFVVQSKPSSSTLFSIFGNGTTGELLCGGYGKVSAHDAISTYYYSSATYSTSLVDDSVNGAFIVSSPGNYPNTPYISGSVIAGLESPNQLTYDRAFQQDVTIHPCFLATSLSAGSSVTIQANSDITLNTPIAISGTSGAFTMQAGGNIFLNASLQLSNDLTFEAGGNIEISAPIFTSSQLTMIAGKNITSSNPVTIQGSTINLVVDNLFPTPPNIGLGAFNFPNITISATTSLRLYAGAFGISQFPATINGTPYRPGRLNIKSMAYGTRAQAAIPITSFTNQPQNLFLIASTFQLFQNLQDWSEWSEPLIFNRLVTSDSLSPTFHCPLFSSDPLSLLLSNH